MNNTNKISPNHKEKEQLLSAAVVNGVLFQAVRDSNFEEIERILKAGADIHALNDGVLQLALELESADTFFELTRRYSFDLKNNWQYLVQAIDCNHLNVVKYLIETVGMDIAINDNIAAQKAVVNNYTDIIEYLLDKGVDFTRTIPFEKAYPLLAEQGVFGLPVVKYAQEAFKGYAFEALQLVLQKGQNKEIFYSTYNMEILLNPSKVINLLLSTWHRPSLEAILKDFKAVNPTGFECVTDILQKDPKFQSSKAPAIQAWLLNLKIETAPVGSSKPILKI